MERSFPKKFRLGVRREWVFRFLVEHRLEHKRVGVHFTTERNLYSAGDLSLETLLAWLGTKNASWSALPPALKQRAQVLVGLAFVTWDSTAHESLGPRKKGIGEDFVRLIEQLLERCEVIAFACALLATSTTIKGKLNAPLDDDDCRKLAHWIDRLLLPIQECYRALHPTDSNEDARLFAKFQFMSGEAIVRRYWGKYRIDPQIIDFLTDWLEWWHSDEKAE